jgi:hypothetical protein
MTCSTPATGSATAEQILSLLTPAQHAALTTNLERNALGNLVVIDDDAANNDD